MQIEVEFEGLKTTFTVSDHKVNDHYDRETEDGGSRASIRDGSIRGSVASNEAHGVKKDRKNFISRTFGQMKEDVAAFFSLSPDSFFFAVNSGILLNIKMAIRMLKTLYFWMIYLSERVCFLLDKRFQRLLHD